MKNLNFIKTSIVLVALTLSAVGCEQQEPEAINYDKLGREASQGLFCDPLVMRELQNLDTMYQLFFYDKVAEWRGPDGIKAIELRCYMLKSSGNSKQSSCAKVDKDGYIVKHDYSDQLKRAKVLCGYTDEKL